MWSMQPLPFRDSLWEILRNYGIPSKIVQLIKQFYTNFSCTINSEADTSFLVKSGVRQGYVMSSEMFRRTNMWSMQPLPFLNPACSCRSFLSTASIILDIKTMQKNLSSETSQNSAMSGRENYLLIL
jgi:hypothetical protein